MVPPECSSLARSSGPRRPPVARHPPHPRPTSAQARARVPALPHFSSVQCNGASMTPPPGPRLPDSRPLSLPHRRADPPATRATARPHQFVPDRIDRSARATAPTCAGVALGGRESEPGGACGITRLSGPRSRSRLASRPAPPPRQPAASRKPGRALGLFRRSFRFHSGHKPPCHRGVGPRGMLATQFRVGSVTHEGHVLGM